MTILMYTYYGRFIRRGSGIVEEDHVILGDVTYTY